MAVAETVGASADHQRVAAIAANSERRLDGWGIGDDVLVFRSTIRCAALNSISASGWPMPSDDVSVSGTLLSAPRGAWRTYNFEVENTHNYVADGLRVHNDSQAVIDLAGSIGFMFGSQIGSALAGDNPFEQIGSKSVIGTLSQNLVEVMTDVGIGVFDPGHDVDIAFQLGDIAPELAGNTIGLVSSFLTAELGEVLGVEGFGADLFTTATGATIRGFATAAFEAVWEAKALSGINNAEWGNVLTGKNPAVVGALAGLVGSTVAHELITPEGVSGAIGSALGSMLGVTALSSIAGSATGTLGFILGNIVAPGLGAFLGSLVGTVIGNWFSDDPDPRGITEYYYQHEALDFLYDISVADGFDDRAFMEAWSEEIVQSLEHFMNAMGSFALANPIDNASLQSQNRKRLEVKFDGDPYYLYEGERFDDFNEVTTFAIADFMKDADAIGGDIFMKRALATSNADNAFTLAGHMGAATDYAHYLNNSAVINELVAADSQTAFAFGWVTSWAQAEELKLADPNPTDFNGGLRGFQFSLMDAGIAVDVSDMKVFKNQATIGLNVEIGDQDVPSEVYSYAHNVRIVENAGVRILQFLWTDTMESVGYTNISGHLSGSDKFEAQETDGRDFIVGPWQAQMVFDDASGARTRNDDIVRAGTKNDLLKGGLGDDWLDGGDGNDRLYGGEGNDVLLGGNGRDLLYAGEGRDDYLQGGLGADRLEGHRLEDAFTIASYSDSHAAVNVNLQIGQNPQSGGTAEGDTLLYIRSIVGSDYNDTIVGHTEHYSILEGGAGADQILGSARGKATASYFFASEAVYASLRDRSSNTADAAGDYYNGNVVDLDGSLHDDVLEGNGQANTLRGWGGDDTLLAGQGADVFHGGPGTDRLSFSELTSVVRFYLEDWRAGIAAVDRQSSPSIRNIEISWIEEFEGSKHHDTLIGWDGEDILFGGKGNDRIEGGASSDALNGGEGHDLLHGNAGSDLLTGEDGNDTLEGHEGDDTLIAGNGDDLLIGHAGADLLRGDDGNDALRGFDGNDSLEGGRGSDILVGGAGADSMVGGEGADWVRHDGAPSKILVNLAYGTGSFGDAHGDTYSAIENAAGTAHGDTLMGTVERNELRGLAGNDSLKGRAGNDILVGGLGADTLDGGHGSDWVRYNNSSEGVWVNLAGGGGAHGEAQGDRFFNIENVLGSGFDDTIGGTDLVNIIQGGNGNDEISGWAGNDRLVGGAGADTLRGGWGADTLVGNAGADWAYYDNAGAMVSVDLVNGGTTGDANGDTYSDINRVLASAHNDTVRGTAASDTLEGGEGNDLLDGRQGNDRLSGGVGHDTLTGGVGADALVGGAGWDWASYTASTVGVSVNLNTAGSGGEAQGDTYNSVEHIRGSQHGDTLIGTNGANRLEALAGNDYLDGQGGNDHLFGGAGNDILVGGAGADLLNGGTGIDWVRYNASSGGVWVNLAAGNGPNGDTFASIENVLGSNYDDSIGGTNDANMLQGGNGDDRLTGWAGDDVLVGGTGADTLDGGAGTDWVRYNSSSAGVTVNLAGGGGHGGEAQGDAFSAIEHVLGSNHNDVLLGTNDANRLDGGNGADTLNGWGGNDVFKGGNGADLYIFVGGFGVDRIIDFTPSQTGERIDLSRVDSIVNYADLVQNHLSQSGADVIVDAFGGHIIRLSGVSLSELNQGDFLF